MIYKPLAKPSVDNLWVAVAVFNAFSRTVAPSMLYRVAFSFPNSGVIPAIVTKLSVFALYTFSVFIPRVSPLDSTLLSLKTIKNLSATAKITLCC